MPVSTKFEMRDDDNVIRNYGRMLIELSAAIPDGVVCFFVSYSYMDKIVSKWHDMGVLTVSCSLACLAPHVTPRVCWIYFLGFRVGAVHMTCEISLRLSWP